MTFSFRSFPIGAAIALSVLLAGCGGGGGGDAPPSDTPLALMVDSMGRQVPEAEFGHGDALAAGADGIAFDEAPIANAQVTLADSGGITRTTTTDALGYYRLDIKGLRPPFIVKVKRADGSELFSAATSGPVARGFVPINVNGLTDKTLGYVADTLATRGGAASSVTAPVLASNLALLDPARAKLRTGLAIPLVNAGFDPASYDPVSAPLAQANADRHAAFLRGLRLSRNAAGRTAVVGTISGPRQVFGANDVAVDGAGNLYVADGTFNVIRKISQAGVMTTLAGSGSAGFADGAGAAASFRSPHAIALGGDGTVYVADYSNHAIRKVTAAGVVSTIAGGPVSGFADGTGSAAKFYFPHTIAVDSNGNLYLTDFNNAVRRITPGGVVTTIAGAMPQQPSATGSGPEAAALWGLAVDAADNLYVGDATNRKVLKIAADGSVSDFYQAPADGVFSPYSLAVDTAGTVYVAGSRVLMITAAGVASTLAGGFDGSADGNGVSAGLGAIGGIAVGANGDVLVADTTNGSIRRIRANGNVVTIAGKASSGFADGPASSATFSGDWLVAGVIRYFRGMGGVAVDAAGTIYIADTGNHAVRRIARTGAVTTVAGNGAPGFANGNGRSASFNLPSDVALDRAGNIFVADSGNNAIRKISASGDVSTLAGNGTAGSSNGAGPAATFKGPAYLATGPDGTVYVSDVYNPAIRKITAAGVVSTLVQLDPLAVPPAGSFALVGPIAVDASGTVLIKGSVRGDIFAVAGDGLVSKRTNITSPWISTPRSLGVDGEGNAYHVLWNQSDGRGTRLVRLSPAGVETDIALDTDPHLFNDQGGDVAVDSSGNIIVMDATNSAIRIVLP